MNRPALLFFGLVTLLTACSTTPTPTPRPAPVLTLSRTDAAHVAATLTPAPVSGRWTLAAAAECGASDGPAIAGDWSSPLVLTAGPGDMLRVRFVLDSGEEFTVSDCVPLFGESAARAEYLR